jgi:hypothetical protein
MILVHFKHKLMKSHLIYIFTFFLFSCQSEQVSHELVGEWAWVKTRGGIADLTLLPSEGNQKSLKFSEQNEIEFYENGKLKSSDTYNLVNGRSIFTSENVTLISLVKQDGFKFSYLIKQDTLFLSEEVHDGFSHTYIKNKK